MSALGKLVVTLGLESAQFTQGLDKAQYQMKQFQQNVETATTGTLRGFALQLASVATVVEVVTRSMQSFNASIQALDRLDEAAQKTGSTVEQLSKLEGVARDTGFSFDKIEAGVVKLVNGLNGAEEETKGAAAAIKALGVEAKDASGNLRDPGVLVQEIAQKLDGFRDGANKTAVALQLFGKSGADLLPYLKDLGSAGDVAARATAEQAAKAAELNDAWAKLQSRFEDSRRSLVSELIPSLIKAVEIVDELKRSSDALKEGGGIKSFADGALGVLALIADTVLTLSTRFKGLFADLEGLAQGAKGVLDRLAAVAAARFGDMATSQKLMAESTQRFADAQVAFARGTELSTTSVTKFTDALAKLNEREQALNATRGLRGSLDARDGFANPVKPEAPRLAGAAAAAAKESVNGLNKALDDLFNKLRNVDDALTKELALLAKGFQTGVISAAKFAEGVALATANSQSFKTLAKALEDANKAIGESAAVLASDYAGALEKVTKQNDAIEESLREQIDSLKDEIATLGMSEKQIKLYNLEKERTKALLGAEDDLRKATINRLFDEKRALIENSEGLKQQQGVWESLGQTVQGFFEDLFTNGKKAFSNLWDTVKRFFAQLAAQLATQYVLKAVFNYDMPVGGNSPLGLLQGLFGGDGKGGGGLTSLFPSLSGLFKGAKGFATTAASIFGGIQAGRLISGGYSLNGGSGNSTVNAGTGIGLALSRFFGPIAALFGGAIGGLVNRLFGRKLADSGIEATLSSSGVTGREFEFYRGGLFRSDKMKYSDLSADTVKFLDDARKSIYDTLKGLGDSLGIAGKQFEQFTYSFKISTKGLSAEQIQAKFQEEFDKFTKGLASSLDFASLDAGIAKMVAEFSGTGDELIAFIDRIARIKPIFDDLKKTIDGFSLTLADFAELTESQVQALQVLGDAIPALTRDAFAQVDKILADANKGVVTQFKELADSTRNLLKDFDAGKVSVEQLAAAGANLAVGLAQATAKIAETQQNIADLINNQREGFLLDGLNTEEQYKFFQDRVNKIFDALGTATDPEEIEKLTRQILDYQSRAAGLLSPEERKRLSPEFLSGLDRVESLADERLAQAKKELNDNAKPIKDQIAEALAQFLEDQKDTAETNKEAAELNYDAAVTPRKLEITINDQRGFSVRESGN